MVYLTRDERLDEAERLATNVLPRAGPLRPYVLDTLAKVYAKTGRWPEARAALAEAEAAAPSGNKALQERLAQSKRELVDGVRSGPAGNSPKGVGGFD
jgi:predicted Zn-dependent protease